jgi:pimeloyl-ACP methyl ester carboxylesterase
METGGELLFLLDTGAGGTLLDKSLEPSLGPRLGTVRINYPGLSHSATAGLYKAPALYLGNTRLVTGPRIGTDDLHHYFFGRPVAGILGIDCLSHYCLQLDFNARQLRFLDANSLSTEGLGNAFPLTVRRRVLFHSPTAYTQGDFFGLKKARFELDTGHALDGSLTARLLRRAIDERVGIRTNLLTCPELGWCPRIMSNGEAYTEVALNPFVENSIGLRFLARHKVTLNFPKKTMYLHRTSLAPLAYQDGPGPECPSAATLGWWEMQADAGSQPGEESLAESIMSPPNLHPARQIRWELWTNYEYLRPRFFKIPIAQPKADLSLAQLHPGDYSANPFDDAPARKPAKAATRSGSARNSQPPEKGTIVMLHDYNSQKELLNPWALALSQAGFRLVLVDLRGHGESSGQVISFGKYEVSDLGTVLDYMAEQGQYAGPVGVLGIGYGANVALHWAVKDPRVVCGVAIAPYNEVDDALGRMARQAGTDISRDVLHRALARVAARLDINWSDWSGQAAMRRLNKPFLLICATNDAICSPHDAEVLKRSSPVSTQTLVVSADHEGLADRPSEFSTPVKEWFQTHIRPVEPPRSGAGESKKQAVSGGDVRTSFMRGAIRP